jgi:hypothetical protein
MRQIDLVLDPTNYIPQVWVFIEHGQVLKFEILEPLVSKDIDSYSVINKTLVENNLAPLTKEDIDYYFERCGQSLLEVKENIELICRYEKSKTCQGVNKI